MHFYTGFKGIRDSVTFTSKRVIAVNVQGMTFSVETAGVLDLDSELELWFSGLGLVTFEFSGASDIVKIGQTIGTFIL